MADVLKRGPVGTDEQIGHEVYDLTVLLRRYGALLTVKVPTDPALATKTAMLFEDIANRLLDVSEALNERYLEAAGGDLRSEAASRRAEGETVYDD
jgi:hypothetical protein